MRFLENGSAVTNHPFWLSVDVGLTGVAGERKANNTAEALVDLVLTGGATNLSGGAESKVKVWEHIHIEAGQSSPMRATVDVPILSLFGKRDSALPYQYFPAWPLRKGHKLRTEVLNSTAGAESRGWLVFAGEPADPKGATVKRERLQGRNVFALNLDMSFTATAGETTSDKTDALDFDFMIVGAYTDTDAASIGVRLSDDAGRPWCHHDEFTPVWALAGRNASERPLLRWSTPYVLPAGGIMRAAFRNAVAADTPESNGTLTLVGYQLP